MYLDRRKLLKIGGASAAGLALSGLDVPWLQFKPALATSLSEDAWCFGVMADTQWRAGTNAGVEPASCAVSIINALNEQFIQHGCKFVIQVGDLVDKEAVDGVRTLPTRAKTCQALYDNGIGFYPVRGNHESTATAAGEMVALFPQTMGEGEHHLAKATNFTSPMEKLKGLSYSFDYDNVRCVLIDQFVRLDETNADGTRSYNNNLLDQIDWVEQVLSSKDPDQHAFVFAHKNLIGQNHKDVITGKDLAANPTERDRFIQVLDSNGVRYCLGGHDHMHHRSIVTDAAQKFNVDQIICSSNSYKFYIPKSGDDGREFPVCQELFTIGFYIFTIDGARVTVDFYSASHGQDYGDADLVTLPPLTFYLRERFGYSLNGSQHAIERGKTYAGIEEKYGGYSAKILSGINGNAETDYLNRDLSKTINTGWAASSSIVNAGSPIFSLWGLVDNLSLYDESLTGSLPAADESTATDTYTLALTYNKTKFRPSQLAAGRVVLAVRDTNKLWKNAVALNTGGTKKFVFGPWNKKYGLGTYGVDTKTGTAWAVLNNEGDFIVKYV